MRKDKQEVVGSYSSIRSVFIGIVAIVDRSIDRSIVGVFILRKEGGSSVRAIRRIA